MSEALALIRLGMRCPVGLGAAETAASLRAGVSRKSESVFVDARGEPVVLGQLRRELLPPLLPELDEATLTEPLQARMLRLAAAPLREAVDAYTGPPLSLYLAVPGPEGDAPARVSGSFIAWLARQAGLELGASRLFPGGGASFFTALLAARDELTRPGGPTFVLVGGVDSHWDALRLAALERAGRLRTAGPQDAFTPGEGAAFSLLCTDATRRRLDLDPLAWISGLAVETASEAPALGGLARACRSCFADAPAELAVGLVVAGLNGESRPAREWGVAQLRNPTRVCTDTPIEHPAAHIGDAGAALGPVMLGSAAIWLRSGKARAPALVWAMSDDGRRGAALVYREG